MGAGFSAGAGYTLNGTILAAAQANRHDEDSRKANATKIDFPAMERGVSLTSTAAYEDKGYDKS